MLPPASSERPSLPPPFHVDSGRYKNPFYCVIQTPGTGNAIRVINQNTVEFPFDAWVVPYEVADEDYSRPVMGGGW